MCHPMSLLAIKMMQIDNNCYMILVIIIILFCGDYDDRCNNYSLRIMGYRLVFGQKNRQWLGCFASVRSVALAGIY